MSRSIARAAGALTACLVLPLFGLDQAHALQSPEVSLLSPSEGDTVTGDITFSFSVDLHDESELTLSVDNTWTPVERTVTKAQCPETCSVDLVFDADSFDGPLLTWDYRFSGSWRSATSRGDLPIGLLHHVAPVERSGYGAVKRPMPSPALTDYEPGVADRSVVLAVSGEGAERPPDERIEARLYPASIYSGTWYADRSQQLWQGDGSWSTTGEPQEGTVEVDTSGLPEGTYGYSVRPRSANGGYAAGADGFLTVRHSPAVAVITDQPTPQAPGSVPYVWLSVKGPLAVAPGGVRVSVDGVTSTLPAPWPAIGWDSAVISRTTTVPATTQVLAPGRHELSAQLLTAGPAPRALGPERRSTFDVVKLGLRVVAAPVFVGRPNRVTFMADAPVGMLVSGCWADFKDAGAAVSSGHQWCQQKQQHVVGITSWIPQNAGQAQVVMAATGPVHEQTTTKLTVYPARNVSSLVVPAARYGALTTVTASLRDSARVTSQVAARPGLPVTLQFRKAGTSAWVNLRSGVTAPGGLVSFTYRSSASGALRVAYPSTAPGVTEYSAAASQSSSAAVTLTSAPKTAYRNRALVVKANVNPYQAGATVSLQTRPRGTATWVTVRTSAAPVNGAVSFTTTFPSARIYDVRVVRSATSLNSAGVSSTAIVTVR